MHGQDNDAFLLENWMGILRPSLDDRPLTELTLPGSHDSNTYTIPRAKFGSSLARCQDLSIYQQAMHGIRFFDFRYGTIRRSPRPLDKHGPMAGGDFIRNFEELASFAELHPSEFIIVSFQSQEKVGLETRKAIAAGIVRHIGPRMVQGQDADTWFDLSTTPFRELIAHHKNFLVFARDELFDNGDFSESFFRSIGVFNLRHFMNSSWHNVSDEKVLLERFLGTLLNKPADDKRLFGSQLILTTQRNPKKLLSDFFRLGVPGIRQLTSCLHREHLLTRFVAKTLDQHLGVILLDFINLFGEVIKMAILRNARDELRVHRVFFGEHDITAEVLPHVFCNRFLYLPCTKDLRRRFAPKTDQICVTYSTGNSVSQAFVSPHSPKHVFVGLDPLQGLRKRVGKSTWAVFLTPKGFRFEWFIFEPNEHERRELCRLRDARLALVSEAHSVGVFNPL